MKHQKSISSRAARSLFIGGFAFVSILNSAYGRGPGTNFVDDFEAGIGNWTQVSTAYTNLLWSSAQNKVPAGSGHSAYSTNCDLRMYASSLVPGGLGITSASYKFTYWLYDAGNTRTFAEVRSYVSGGYDGTAGYRQVIDIGKYNSVNMTGENYDGTKYQARLANGSPNGWFNLNAVGAPSRSTAWHKFEIERGNDPFLNQSVYIFYVDGVIGRVFTNSYEISYAWNSVIMGAGIGSSSGGGDSYFDGFQVISGESFIFQDPGSQTATLGDSVDLTVRATGDYDGPYYQWRMSGTNLLGRTDSTLHFDNVALTNTGSYSVVVSNALGVKTSGVAVLTVNPPLFVTMAPTSIICNPGSNEVFTATATGQGTISYLWNKNGGPMSGQTDSTLTLSGVGSGDAATYTVTVHNGIDPDCTSGPGVLILNSAPVIAAINNVTNTVGTTVYVPVSATDDFSGSGVFADFEGSTLGATAVFQAPRYSGTSYPYVDGQHSQAYVTNWFPAGNARSRTQVYCITCNFTNSATPGWARVTSSTFNPTVMFTTPLKFDLCTTRPMGVAVGLRELTPSASGAIGSNAGGGSGPIEFVGDTASGTPPVPLFTTPAGVWTNLTYDLADPSFTNSYIKSSGLTGFENGYLDSTTGEGALEDLAITPADGLGLYTIYLDNVQSVPADAIVYSLDIFPGGASIDPYTGVVTFTPASAGTFNFTVRATDGLSLPSTRNFTVTATSAVSRVTSVVAIPAGANLKVTYSGGAATSFVLIGTNNLTAPLNTWPVIATTNNTTPATFTVPMNPAAGAAMFYDIKSQ